MKKIVFCTLRVVGFHSWPNAPEEYAYLRASHRHEFHVRVEVPVQHNERDVEFIALKCQTYHLLSSLGSASRYGGRDFGARSCETLAEQLRVLLQGHGIEASRIEVSEDGENGAVLEW